MAFGKAEELKLNITGDSKKLTGALDKAGSRIGKFSQKIGAMGKTMTIAGAAITTAFAAIVVKTAAVGDKFDKMSLRTGVAVEELSALAYAADISGTDIGTLEKGLKGLTKTMDDASQGIGEGLEAFEFLDIAVIEVEGSLKLTNEMLKEAATKMADIVNPTDLAIGAIEGLGISVTDVEGDFRPTVDILEEAAEKINAIEDPTERARLAFDILGVSAVDIGGNLRSTVDILKEAATKISEIEDPTKQAALAMDLFGAKAGPQLLPLLKAGGDGIEDLMAKAEELGITMSTEAATAAAEFTDRMTDLKSSLAGTGRTIGDTLIPVITPLIEKVVEMISKVRDWISENEPLVENIVKWGAALGVALAILGPILVILPGLIAGVTLLSGVFAPFLIGAGIIAGLIKINSLLDDMNENAYKVQQNLENITVAEIDIEIESLATQIKNLKEQMKFASEQPLATSAQFGSLVDMENALMNLEMKIGLLIERREELTQAGKDGINVDKKIVKIQDEINKELKEYDKKLKESTDSKKLLNAQNEIGNKIYGLTHTALDIAIKDLEEQRQKYIDLGIAIEVVNEWFELEIKTLNDLDKEVFKCGQQFMKFGEDVEVAGDKLPTEKISTCGQAFLKMGEDVEVAGDALPPFWNKFLKLEDILKTAMDNIKKSVLDLKGTIENELSTAFYNVLTGTQTFGEAWNNMWSNIGLAIIKQLTNIVAQMIVAAASQFLLAMGPIGWVILLGGAVAIAAWAASQSKNLGGEIKGFDTGGGIDTVPIMATPGEYMIAKPMVDFIKQFKMIPSNLISAIAGGFPTPAPAFASGGSIGDVSDYGTQNFGTKIYVDIHDNRISDDVDVRKLAATVSGEILKRINLNRRH